jgi:hypothetical protein
MAEILPAEPLFAQFDEIEDWSDYAALVVDVAKQHPGDLGLRDRIAALAEEKFDNVHKLVFDIFAGALAEAERKTKAEVAQPAPKVVRLSAFARDRAERLARMAKALPEPEPKQPEPEPTAPDNKVSEGEARAKPDAEADASPKAAPPAPSVEDAIQKGALVVTGAGPPMAGNVALDEFLAAMNERHAVIGNVGGKCRILEWVPSELDPGALVPSFQSKTDFINRYAHRQVGWTRRGDPLTAGEWWFDHPGRADYRGTVFKPGKPSVIVRPESGSWLNLWRGWGVMPERGQWPLLRNHVEQILSAADSKVADYNIRWVAWGFQHPEEQAEAALVLRGKKGGGKGFWLGTIREIYGPHGLQITHTSHLTGQFNAHLWTCAYLFADEAFWAGDKQGEAVLKGLITERPLMVTKKGIDTVPAVNCVKLAMSSNADWVVPASHDERRYAVTDIDPRYAKGNAPDEERKQYFGAIKRELAEGGAAAMLYDLLQMNLGDWHPREVPMTAGLMRQKKQSLRGNFQWFEPLLQSGTLPAPKNRARLDRPNRIVTEDLLAYVKTFRGLEYATEESIAGFLYDEMGFEPKLSPNGNKYREPGGGKRGWQFPPLLELRERWETKFGGDWNWHDPEITEWQKAPAFLNRTA